MKRRGAEILGAKLEGMTLEQEVAFWQQRTEELLARKRKLQAQRETLTPR
jgi:hypothetical protein